VLVHSLPLKAKEKDIWAFFVKQGCGKVSDIRIIKDPKSHKSKGIAYVEFFTAESIQKALHESDKPFECNGRVFQGIKIMHSQAEKNRAAAAARYNLY
jgi:RNA-binding protein 39